MLAERAQSHTGQEIGTCHELPERGCRCLKKCTLPSGGPALPTKPSPCLTPALLCKYRCFLWFFSYMTIK